MHMYCNMQLCRPCFSRFFGVHATSQRHSCPWECSPTRRECWMNYRGPGFLAAVWFGFFPLPPSPLLQLISSIGDTQKDWERETTCWRERGEGGGRGVKSYDGETAWSSINNSILSALDSILKLNKQSGECIHLWTIFVSGGRVFPVWKAAKQAGRQAGWQAGRQAGRLACSPNGGPASRPHASDSFPRKFHNFYLTKPFIAVGGGGQHSLKSEFSMELLFFLCLSFLIFQCLKGLHHEAEIVFG